jgi:hypothetical protein
MPEVVLATPANTRRWPVLLAGALLSAGIIAGAIEGNLSANLHGEYFNIAQSIYRGEGFANPFAAPTGPTAWQAPLLPSLEAAVLWMSAGDPATVVRVLVVLHVGVLMGTGLLVVGIARQTAGPAAAIGAAVVFAVALLCNFRLCFEIASDPWLNMLFLDLWIAGLFWLRPLGSTPRALAWGLGGGLGALANPTLGLVWGTLTVVRGLRDRAGLRLGVALFAAALAVAPWMVRNYLVLGRWVPVKSNLAFELYQAQCLQPPGVLTVAAIGSHPSNGNSPERQEYRHLGEPDYVARKWQQFTEAVAADPLDLLDRVARRFLCATLWYESHNPVLDARRPWLFRLNRALHPVPFLALLILLIVRPRGPSRALMGAVAGVYILYLLPYIATSYYDRYGAPLLGVKALLIVWAAESVSSSMRDIGRFSGRRQS